MRVLELSDTGLMAEMPLGKDKTNGQDEIHGGAFFTFADTMAGAAAYHWGQRNLEEGFSCVTSSSTFHFLRPARNCEKAVCKATYRKTGQHIMVIDTTICNEKQAELCCGTFQMYVIHLEKYKNSGFAEV